MFQFHNGTINTIIKFYILNSVKSFQFHNGTINTILELIMKQPMRCFNSTTVQLIPNRYCQRQRLPLGFNSTTVQLILFKRI